MHMFILHLYFSFCDFIFHLLVDQCVAMHVRWTSLGRLEAALTSVCWEMATRPELAAVAPGSAWAATASPAKVSISVMEE